MLGKAFQASSTQRLLWRQGRHLPFAGRLWATPPSRTCGRIFLTKLVLPLRPSSVLCPVSCVLCPVSSVLSAVCVSCCAFRRQAETSTVFRPRAYCFWTLNSDSLPTLVDTSTPSMLVYNIADFSNCRVCCTPRSPCCYNPICIPVCLSADHLTSSPPLAKPELIQTCIACCT